MRTFTSLPKTLKPQTLASVGCFHVLLLLVLLWSQHGHPLNLTVDLSDGNVSVHIPGNPKRFFSGTQPWRLSRVTLKTNPADHAFAYGNQAWDDLEIHDKETGRVVFSTSFDPGSLAGMKAQPREEIRNNAWGQLVLPGKGTVEIRNLDGAHPVISVKIYHLRTAVISGESHSGETFEWTLRHIPDLDHGLEAYGRELVWRLLTPFWMTFWELAGRLVRMYFLALALLAISCAAFLLFQKVFVRLTPEGEAPPEKSSLALAVHRWVPGATMILLAVVFFALLGHINDRYYERIPHVQDSICQLFQAKYFATGHLHLPSSPDKDTFAMQFMVDKEGRWFSQYSFGWPLVLMFGVLVGAHWLVTPLVTVLCLVMAYLLCKEAYGSRGTGLLAALILGAAPFTLVMGSSFMNHPVAQLYGLTATYAMLRAVKDGNIGFGVLAGLGVGLLFNTRPLNGVLMVLLTAAWGLWALRKKEERPRAFRALAGWAGAGALMFLAFLAVNWAVTGDPFKIPYQQYRTHLVHASRFNWEEYWFIFVNGLQIMNCYLGALILTVYNWPYALTWLTLAFPLLPFLTKRPHRYDLAFLGVILGSVGIYMVQDKVVLIFGPRVYYEFTPFLAILTARGAMLLGERGKEWFGKESRSHRWAMRIVQGVAVAFLLSLAGWNLNQFLHSHKYRGDKVFYFMPRKVNEITGFDFVRPYIQEKVRKAGIHNAVVLVDEQGDGPWFKYASVFAENEPFLDSDIVYGRWTKEETLKNLRVAFPGRAFYRTTYDESTPVVDLP